MRAVALLTTVGAVVLAPAARGDSGSLTDAGRAYEVAYAARTSAAAAHLAIPAWARKYNMNCSGCHYPAPPRLNATGIRFRWAGYRMPEEMGEKVDVSQVSNYLAVRGRMRYEYSKTESQPVSTSAFTFNDATVFYAGALGRNFGAFKEL